MRKVWKAMIAASTFLELSSTIPAGEMATQDAGGKAVAAKTTTMRLPQDWIGALEKLGESIGGYSAFLRALAWPVLNGQIKVAIGENDQVSTIEGRGADGQRLKIVLGPAVRPLGEPVVTTGPMSRSGRPKMTETEKAMRQLARAAAKEGVDPEALKEQIEAAVPAPKPKRRKRAAAG